MDDKIDREPVWNPILGVVAYSLITWFVFAIIGGSFDAPAIVAENPAVMEKAEAAVDEPGNSSIPFKILRQGQNSFYGVDALIGRDSSAKDFNKPKVFLISDANKYNEFWTTYIERDPSYEQVTGQQILPSFEKEVVVVVFRGVQDSDKYTMKVNGARLPAPASGPIIVDVTFNNPNFETYSYPKKFCSPFVVITINKESLQQLGAKKVRVFVSQVNHQTLDAETFK